MSIEHIEVDIAFVAQARLGEGPVWDDTTGTLIFVDGEAVLRFDPAAGTADAFQAGGRVGAAVLDVDGNLVLARERSFVRCGPGGTPTEPIPGFAAPGDVRFNDGAVDPWGRVVAGTMDLQYTRPVAALYRLGHDGAVTQLLDGVILSNGLQWTADRRRMYYADSGTLRVDVFDVDDHGDLGERRPFVSFDDGRPGGPDGLTLDVDGGVWVACWPRSEVHRYAPDGRLDAVIRLPVKAVTSVAFGGGDLGDLYITTGHFRSKGCVEPEAHAGDLFVARPGVQGVLPHRYRALAAGA